MTSAEAEQRIILSRRTLNSYLAMASAGDGPSILDLTIFSDEVLILAAIGREHPSKALELDALLGDWEAFLVSIRKRRMH